MSNVNIEQLDGEIKNDLPYIRLKKTHDMFAGKHPNQIHNGYVAEGTLCAEIALDQPIMLSTPTRYFKTSWVTSILARDGKGRPTTITTENSTYEISYND